MDWAIYGGGRAGAPNRAVRLHLGFHLLEDKPVVAQVSTGQLCERKAWQQKWQRGAAYVGDRYYGEDYRLFAELQAHGCHFVVRLCEQAVVNVEEEVAVDAADHAAGVRRKAWVRLGADARARARGGRVRVVWVETPTEGTLRLVTNLPPETLSAELVARVYRRRPPPASPRAAAQSAHVRTPPNGRGHAGGTAGRPAPRNHPHGRAPRYPAQKFLNLGQRSPDGRRGGACTDPACHPAKPAAQRPPVCSPCRPPTPPNSTHPAEYYWLEPGNEGQKGAASFQPPWPIALSA